MREGASTRRLASHSVGRPGFLRPDQDRGEMRRIFDNLSRLPALLQSVHAFRASLT